MQSTEEKAFLAFLKEMNLLEQAVGLLEWDSQTGMPKKSSSYRGEVVGYLSGMAFEKSTGKKMAQYLADFKKNPDKLSELGKEVYTYVQEDYDLNHALPVAQYIAFTKDISEADDAWRKAREVEDFKVLQPSLEKIVKHLKNFIPLWQKNEKIPYDVLLNQYEPGMTVEVLDKVFAELKAGIMTIRQTLAEKGTAPRTDFMQRFVSKESQKEFVLQVIKELGYDITRGRLDDTIHPFMLDLNRDDARITTRWNEHDFPMAVYGVMHEAGHGLYEQNIAEKYAYTPLDTGASMGIHESQSLFNEIIVGSNKAFWQKQYAFFQDCAKGEFDDIDFDTFYKGMKETKPHLIRIESDALTYPLHIIIRYEIEKMIFNEGVAIADLPKIWNDKYEEYLGIRPANDLEGILQDVHWSNGSFGYFPSYALGYMYAAQLQQAMVKEIDFDAVLASDDYSAITKWLTENIHQYGASRKPNQLLQDATGEGLNPQYLLDFLRKLYYDVYEIEG